MWKVFYDLELGFKQWSETKQQLKTTTIRYLNHALYLLSFYTHNNPVRELLYPTTQIRKLRHHKIE